MIDLEFIKELTFKIAKVGKENKQPYWKGKIKILNDYFTKDHRIKTQELDLKDGKHTRREIISRFLLLTSVLDQGPDIDGARMLLEEVVNKLYKEDVKILHNPLDFFRHFRKVRDTVKIKHEKVKKVRADQWAKEANTSADKYNLFFGQSMRGMVSIKQCSQFVLCRWGMPLAIFYLLGEDGTDFVSFIERWGSSEIMSKKLKEHPRYGLGKMIGDKSCHVFAKNYVYALNLVSKAKYKKKLLEEKKERGWDNYSYEIPFDSNVGRVLFRSGWLTSLFPVSQYRNWNVIQEREGPDYIRVTNIRGKNIKIEDSEFKRKYNEIVTKHLKTKGGRWRKVEIQQIPNALLLGTEYKVGHFDDALVHIGRNFCFNHSNPRCEKCPLNSVCEGYKEKKSLIEDYET